MSSVIGYLRVSTDQQSTHSQKNEIDKTYRVSKWFDDSAVSGAIKAKERTGLSGLLEYVREGDTVVVYSIDRLGRNTIDVLETVESLQLKGVALVSIREGFDLTSDHGKLLLTMLAGLAELERKNIRARQLAGLEKARALGRNLGRKKTIDDYAVCSWRVENCASIKDTAQHFNISVASVKRACSNRVRESN